MPTIEEISAKLERLTDRFETLWQRSYARLVRRGDADQEQLVGARRWASSIAKIPVGDLIRFRKLLSSATKGKMLIALDSQEYQALKGLLKRKRTGGVNGKNGKDSNGNSK